MPSQVRIISRPNSRQWDDIIDQAAKTNMRQENTYGGITNPERADEVRKKLRTAARHQNVASRVYWNECDGKGRCKFGNDCAYHVYYTVYPIEEGREYKRQQSGSKQNKRR